MDELIAAGDELIEAFEAGSSLRVHRAVDAWRAVVAAQDAPVEALGDPEHGLVIPLDEQPLDEQPGVSAVDLDELLGDSEDSLVETLEDIDNGFA